MHPHSWQMVSHAMFTLMLFIANPTRAQTSAPPTTMDTPAGKMIVIDGSKSPGDIPEHAWWRHCFYKLAHASRLKATDYIDSLGLSPDDMSQVLRTAGQQAARDDECAKRIEGRQRELQAQGARPEALADAWQAITIDCRARDLDARDRLFERLTPEGREQLRVWADGIRRGMTVYWPANDIEQFKRPY
jgi:hypothetical protein